MMSGIRLTYPSPEVCGSLQSDLLKNLSLYSSGAGFAGNATDSDWSNPTGVFFDLQLLKELDKYAVDSSKPLRVAKIDAEAAIVVWKCLRAVSPQLASEGRIWVRLCHIECFDYASTRWIKKPNGNSADTVAAHFFAGNNWGRIRDDNAIGRLWWTAYAAHRSCPEDWENAVRAIFRSADVRLGVMDRGSLSVRRPIIRGIVRAVQRTQVADKEDRFREFIKNVNRLGGGHLFELMDDVELDAFFTALIPRAGNVSKVPSASRADKKNKKTGRKKPKKKR